MTTAQQQIREIRDEIKELSNLLEKQARSAIREVGNGHGLHVSRDEIREIAEQAGVSARRFLTSKKAQVRVAADKYEDTVSTHPWISTGAAVLGGMILGALMRR